MKFTKDQIEQYEKYRHELVMSVANSISPFTIQLFFENKRNIPKATGSGVLFEIDKRHFLITAAHVIAEHPDNTFAIIGTDGVLLGGLMHTVALPKTDNRKDDKVDVAFIELESNVVDRFKQQHSFLNLVDIQTEYFSYPSAQYLLYGYPTTKTKSKKINGEDVIVAQPFIYTAKELLTFRYQKFGFKKPYHVAINFTGEILSNVNKNAHLAPDLGGISGSGLWHLPNFPSENVIKERKLIGIIIERIKELNNKVIVATSIAIITEFMRDYLKITTIPKSSTVNIKSRIV